MKVERNQLSISGAGTKVGPPKFSWSTIAAGGDGRLSRDGSGNSRVISAMLHQTLRERHERQRNLMPIPKD